MFIESVLIHLGFKENNVVESDYFQMFTKEGSHLFVFESSKDNRRYFSSASGEFTGNSDDLIVFYYKTENSSLYNEEERMIMFKELHKEEKHKPKNLKKIDSFNLYQIILKEAEKTKDNALVNSVETTNIHYFFFMDEERIKGGKNILGVVSLNKETRKESILKFSELDRSIYFTNPSIKSDAAVIFNSFNEMLAFKKLQKETFFYIVVKGKFNENHARTIGMVLSSKGIKKTYLAFPDSLKGYWSDLNYLSVFSNIKVKNRTAFYKLSIPVNKQSELLLEKLKNFKKVVEKDIESNQISQLIGLSQGKDHLGNINFVVELPKIANVIKGFLVLGSKFLFKDEEYKIIKPKEVFWNVHQNPIKNVDKEFKLNMFDSIKEVYSYN
ncbi:hypothetical protein HN014_22455 (plasmid) [Aquimarina sp. TRL1]|uniref:hypothetical protein n=1 Tax=Aquimarina sp. (strain TRL1) TaxID=2736252 RepID=UPI00158875A0|nr:hypothetical protein [Aquimarina sp. TRL1]QKX07764.1 hypothetical protein HN014_22455 [Aquimarina sp. TRL1]